MNKKEYMRPAMQANSIATARIVCISNITNNVGIKYGGGGNGSARAQERGSEEELNDLPDTDLW